MANMQESFEEENFEELVEQYISDEEINAKIELEDEDEVVEQSNHRSSFNDEDVISIGSFITDYLGLNPTNVSCKRGLDISHASLKQLGYKSVIGVSNEFAEYNLNYVKNHILLVVKDYKGNFATYLNPKYLVEYIESTEKESTEEATSDDIVAYIDYVNKKLINESMERVIAATTKARKVGTLRKEMKKYDKLQRR